MRNYSLKMLYSGSKGNAALLTAGDTAILIDAGQSAKCLTTALAAAGWTPERISAIFLTHEHRDHTAALSIFLKTHPVPVHTTLASAVRLEKELGAELAPLLVPHPPVFSVDVGHISLQSFPTPHDSAGSVGYRITIRDKERSHVIGYATDLGHITPAVEQGLLGAEAVVLEANHDPDMLQTGPYPAFLKSRIASARGHLSNGDCAALLARLSATGTRRFLLAHLSEVNNLPELALCEARAALAGTNATVKAADPGAITEL